MFSIQRCVRRVGALGVVGLMAGGLMAVGTFNSNAQEVSCFGKAATITGTDGDEFLTGTNGDDSMVGLAGADTLQALEGNDVVCGNEGPDELFGEGGTDALDGGPDKDICNYTNGAAQAEGDEKYENCETTKMSRAEGDPGADPEPADNPLLAIIEMITGGGE